MASRRIKAPNGNEITLSSDELSAEDLLVAEVLLEIAADQGSATIRVSEDELARRLIRKGYDPNTGRPLH